MAFCFTTKFIFKFLWPEKTETRQHIRLQLSLTDVSHGMRLPFNPFITRYVAKKYWDI